VSVHPNFPKKVHQLSPNKSCQVFGDSNSELDPDIGEAGPVFQVAFYADNYTVLLGADGNPTATRSGFVPGPNGDIAWFRSGGRLFRHKP
jgi:hypothetical protein